MGVCILVIVHIIINKLTFNVLSVCNLFNIDLGIYYSNHKTNPIYAQKHMNQQLCSETVNLAIMFRDVPVT